MHCSAKPFNRALLELFDSAIPNVLAEVRRVLESVGHLGTVAMAETDHTNAMTDLYVSLHRHWPHVVDCRPIDVACVMQTAQFQTTIIETATIWSLPVVAALIPVSRMWNRRSQNAGANNPGSGTHST